MPAQELQSAKYLAEAPDYSDYVKKQKKPTGRLARFCGLLFRAMLILGLVGAVYWFYRNQDPILANIRSNSGAYTMFFKNLVKKVGPDGSNQFAVEEPAGEINPAESPEATPVSYTP